MDNTVKGWSLKTQNQFSVPKGSSSNTQGENRKDSQFIHFRNTGSTNSNGNKVVINLETAIAQHKSSLFRNVTFKEEWWQKHCTEDI